MLRVIAHKSAEAAGKYYTEGLKREDYYTEKQEIVGKWHGLAANRLGLSGDVQQTEFLALVDNRNPATGERLTARTNAERRVGYDLNFHAPKSLSVLHALTGDKAILEAFRSAVAETMTDLEKQAATRIRRGKADSERVTGNLVWAEFVHLTARPVGGLPDPHLHVHCFAPNATYDDKEGRWKAVSWAGIKKDADYHEAAFHARLSGKLAALGYGIERTAKGWEIAGISRTMIERFSRRGEEINRLAAEKGITDPKKKDALGAATRKGKRHGLVYSELVKEWAGRLTPLEKEEIAKISARKAPQLQTGKLRGASGAMDDACQKLFERNSVIRVKELVGSSLRFGVGRLTPEAAWREFERRGMITRKVGDELFCTTVDVLAEEIALINFVRTGRGMCAPFRSGKKLDIDGRLSPEQRAAVLHLLTNNDQVMAVRGAAGAGKTTLMVEAVKQVEATGVKVFAFAPSADASRGTLRESGFGDAETVAHLLVNRELQQRVKGNVIWIDEAGLLGIRDMWRVMELAGHDTRIILTGDVGQHRPVARGDSLSLIQRYSGLRVAMISENRRQKIATYKQAVDSLAAGDLKSGFEHLDNLGAIVEVQDDAQRYRLLAHDFLALSRKDSVPLVVSPTHAEGAAVTAAIREARQTAGQLGEERSFVRLHNLAWEEAERRRPENYAPGLVVQFNQNVRGFVRGSRFNIAGRDEAGQVWMADAVGRKTLLPLDAASKFDVFEPLGIALAPGDRIRITRNGQSADGRRLNNGSLFTVARFDRKGRIILNTGAALSPDHGHFAYGYCQTSYSAQGKTTRDVLIAQNSASFRASSSEGFYVAVSRGRESVRIFTDDRQELQEAVGNTSLRRAGVDFAGLSQEEISFGMSDGKDGSGDGKTWQEKIGGRFKGDRNWQDILRSPKAAAEVKTQIEKLMARGGNVKKPGESMADYIKNERKQAAGKGRSRVGGNPKPLGAGGLNHSVSKVEAKAVQKPVAGNEVSAKAAKPEKPKLGTAVKSRVAKGYEASRKQLQKAVGKIEGVRKSAAIKIKGIKLGRTTPGQAADSHLSKKDAPTKTVTPPPPRIRR